MEHVDGDRWESHELTFRMPTPEESEMVQSWTGRGTPEPVRDWHRRGSAPVAPTWRRRSTVVSAQRVRAALIDGRLVGFVRSVRPNDLDAAGWPGHTDPGLRAVEVLVTESTGDRRKTAARVLWAYSSELLRTPGVRRIVVDPDAEDDQVIQAAMDAGFQSLGLYAEEERTALLLSVQRHQLRSLAPGDRSGLRRF